MAFASTNWVYDDTLAVSDKDRNALARAKAIEKSRNRDGYRWVRLDAITLIHVPCDENGEPTAEGRRRMQLRADATGGAV